MTPRDAIGQLVQVLQSLPSFTEDDVYSAMDAAGVPNRDADRAYKFTQIACGRTILRGIVGRFSDDYFWLDASGEIVEAGRLENEPFFIEASRVVLKTPGYWVGELGAMSADVAAVTVLVTINPS